MLFWYFLAGARAWTMDYDAVGWYTPSEVKKMLCQKCHTSLATVRYAEVVDGKVMDLHLCPECLAAHQQRPVTGFELAGSVAPGRVAPSEGASGRSRSRARRICKSCGTRLSKVLDTGKVGCPSCYHTFDDVTAQVLTDMHGYMRHLGKTPKVDDVRAQMRSNLQNRRALMRSAVQMESYEEAAVLRDEIKKLEKALNSGDWKQDSE